MKEARKFALLVITARKLNRLKNAVMKAYLPFMQSVFFFRYEYEYRDIIQQLRVKRAKHCEELLDKLKTLSFDWES